MQNFTSTPQQMNVISLSQLVGYAKERQMNTIVTYKDQCVIGDEINLYNDSDVQHLFGIPSRVEAIGLVVCLEGTIKLTCNLQEYDSIFLVPPGTIVQCQDVHRSRVSFVISSTDLLHHLTPRLIKLLPKFMSMYGHNHFAISHIDCMQMKNLIRMLKDLVLTEQDSIYYEEVCEAALLTFQYKWISVLSKIENTQQFTYFHVSRKEELFKNFISYVSADFLKERSVKYYADKMCISPKYLGVIVKEVSGHNANAIIDKCVISEAKNQLKYSDMSIQQISQYLNFSNQSFFGKYFKKHTGLSPLEFRNKV